MKRNLIVLAALSVVTLCSSAALAENRAGAFNLTPVIGGFTFDGKNDRQDFDHGILAGINAGYNLTDRFALEGLIHNAWLDVPNPSNDHLRALSYRLEALYSLFPQNKFVPHLAVGYGGIRYKHILSVDNMDSGVFSYGAGAKYFMTNDIALRADFRHLIINSGPTRSDYEYTLGLNFQFGGTSKIVKPAPVPAPVVVPAPAPVPAPVVVPAPAPAPVPAPVVVPVPAPVVVPVPAAKLTVTPASIDRGSSAILNWSSENSSECMILPGIGVVGKSGSKSVSPATTTDYKLTCKGTGGFADSVTAVNVVQPPADSDKDGVTDPFDKCPNTAMYVKVDKDGCPIIECKSVTLNITFETNSTEIKPRHDDELKTIADKLIKFPKATAVIEGHTDNVGADKANQKLSERRAESVRKYVESKFGVKAGRLTSKGFGESKPIDSNKTEDGRRNNRRVVATFTCPE